MNIYEKYVLPKFLNFACNTKPMRYQREKVVPLAKGNILEVGIGSGLNLPFYNISKVKKIWGLDPSEELNEMARKISSTSSMEVEFLLAGAEQIPLPDNSIDTVLITYTICTIPEIDFAMKEMKRVLRPDGEMIFCEHGKAPDENIVKWQNKINPYWNVIGGGCNINRDIPRLIESAGFLIKSLESMYIPGTPKIFGFNYWGIAIQL